MPFVGLASGEPSVIFFHNSATEVPLVRDG
jgi:hypothetical protein